MFSFLWHTIFFNPIYNGLVFFIDTIPGGDVGLAIIAITVVVKFILLPLSIKSVKSQKALKIIEPKLQELKDKYKDDRQALATATMDVYKEAGINPFFSILLIFIQLPLILSLYMAVVSGGGVALPDINQALLYSFVHVPADVNMLFLGIVDIAVKSWPLALLAGVTQYIQASLTLPKLEAKKSDENNVDFKADFARSMDLNMRYVMPLIITFIAHTLSATVAIYFVVSNLMAIFQEFIVRRHR